MMPFVTPRLVGLGLSLAPIAAVGGWLVPLSAADIAGATRPSLVQDASPVPIGWVNSQPGAAVELRAMTSTDAGACGTATVENRANVPVTGLRFVGVAHEPRVHPSEALDGSSATTDLLDIAVPSGGTATIAVNLLPPDELRPRFAGGRFQAMCALQEIRYGNGEHWSSPPAVIFARTYPEVSRAFLGRDSSGNRWFCRDERGAEYSQGAVIRIALEPGRRARCESGVWVEQGAAPTIAGRPFVWMDVVLPSGHRPALGVEPGSMARLRIGGGSWGFRPTIDPADERRVRLEVHDLTVAPSVRVADLSLSVGAQPVDIPGAGATVQIRSTRNP